MICSPCYQAQPLPRCLETINIGSIVDVNTNVIVRAKSSAGRIDYFNATSDGSGNIILDVTGFNFSEMVYTFTVLIDGERQTLTTPDAIETECIELSFEDGNTTSATLAPLYTQTESEPENFRREYSLQVPANGDTVTIIPKNRQTVVTFVGVIADDFNFAVNDTSKSKIGDELILVITGDNVSNGKTVSFTGTKFSPTNCGTIETDWQTIDGTIAIVTKFDGSVFIGLDNC